ncbi:tRNA (guanine-N(7)-)-methyltransferase non-catalytic subunit wdr4-like [Argonauta hians]
MGHLSMLLDMTLACNDKYLITCDRDEKIRLSLYPNAYNIHSYCLGHTDFVTRLMYVSGTETVISASSDGTIRSWNLKGEALSCLSHGVQVPAKNGSTAAAMEVDGGGGDGDEEKKEEEEAGEKQGTKDCDNLAIIKSMVYHAPSGALAVTFDRSPVIQVYKVIVNETSTTTTTTSIDLQDSYDLPCVPWDIQFGPHSILWVLLPHQEKPLKFLGYIPEDGTTDTFKIKELEAGSLSKEVVQIAKTLTEDWDFLKESVDIPCWTKALAKSRVDNTQEYMKRKQQQQQTKKKQQPQGEKPREDDSSTTKAEHDGNKEEPKQKAAKME